MGSNFHAISSSFVYNNLLYDLLNFLSSAFSKYEQKYKLQIVEEMRGRRAWGTFRGNLRNAYDLLCEFASQTSASPHPSKAFKKGLFFTNLVLLNGETPPFSIVKWLLFQLSLLKVSLKPFQRLAVSKGGAFGRAPQSAKFFIGVSLQSFLCASGVKESV